MFTSSVSRWLLAATFSILLASCSSKVFFSDKLDEDLALTEEELSSLAFYTSQRIILVDADGVLNDPEDDDRVIFSDTAQVIVIDKGSVGQVVWREAQQIGVRFDTEIEGVLVFGSSDPYESYYLLAEQWLHGFGILKYGEEFYYATPSSGNVALWVDLREARAIQRLNAAQ
jgi:hypothetical protein